VVILGGAKVSDKIGVINRLLEKADTIIIGGGMAYTFRKLVQGISIGKSLYKAEWEPIAQAALDKAKERGVKILIPVDAMITDAFDFDAKKFGNIKFTAAGESIPDGWEGVDIGPESVKLFAKKSPRPRPSSGTARWACSRSRRLQGHLRHRRSHGGQHRREEHHRRRRQREGREERPSSADKMTFISTGGGASLELLEGKALPGVACLAGKSLKDEC
jgi:phosphoglycerate kinase